MDGLLKRKGIRWMNKEFQTLRKKQRFGLRKLNIGVVSVLLGFTIFGYNLVSQAPVAHAAASAVATSGASGSGTGGASGSQASNSQAASQAAPETQVTAPAASQSSESANLGNETSSQASQAGTVSDNQTASNTNTTPSSQTVSVNETTSSATQARTLMRTLMMNLAVIKPDTTLPTTTQTYTKVEQPLLYDYGLHVSATGTRDGKTWVDKTVAKGIFGQDYPGHTLDTIFGSKTGIITSKPDKYFFAAYVDFSESYHRVILLARSKDLNDKNLYSYTIHTYTQNNSTTTTKPGDSTREQYIGTGRSKHDLIFHNYDGDSFSVKLNGFESGYEKYGLLPVFDGGLLDPTYGSNTLDQNDTAAKTKSISFWASMIPQETSTKVRYVDQATGKDIVQPMEISGFGYQGFKVNGEAPTVPGYHLVSSPKSLGLPYEDGTIAPYKVGQTYDLALSDSVVIKQTVIHTDGTVRATPYYKGSPLKNASKVLGRESYNDHMSFDTPDGKYYTYTNRIGQVGDSYIYYYAKNSDPNVSEMRLHFIDVTGVNNSSYAPSDGPELDVDKVQTSHGNIGENYSFTYTVPKGYDQVGTSDVTGKYSVTHHDAYVYVKKYTVAAGKPVTLTHGQKVKEGDSLDSSAVTLKDAKGQAVSLPDGAKVVWATAPDTSEVGNDKTGQAKVVYGDQSESEPVTVTYNVMPNDADQYTPTVKDKTKVDDPTKLTDNEKKAVEDNIRANNPGLPEGTKIKVGDNGDTTITYPDTSVDTIPGKKLVEEKTSAELDPTVKDKTKVDDPTKLTDNEKKAVEDNIRANNPGLPEGTKIKVGDNGDTTITYPDTSVDTIPGDQVIEGKSDADKNTPNVPGGDKVKVDDPTKLTDNEKNAVKDKVDEANSNLPDGTKVTVGDDGTTTITYPDGSTNTISGHDLVTGKTDADKYPLNPGQAVDVVDPNHLTQAEQDQVKEAIRTTNPTTPIATITVDTAGNVQVTFADGSTTTLQANLHKHVTEATTGSAMKPGVGTNGGQTKGATSTNQTATKQQAQQHLPQTGDQPATWAMLSGLGVAFLGLLGLKKKRED